MSRAANPHWIGPKRGTYVTVMIRSLDAEDGLAVHAHLVLFRAVVVGPYRARLCDEIIRRTVPIDPLGLDTTWCYDWDGDNVNALKALLKLQETT